MYTADYASGYTHDRNGVSRALDNWRARRPSDVTLWRRPMKEGPAISLPYKGQRLSETELAYVKKASAERQAAFWNEALKDNTTYGPHSGLRVFVGGVRVNDRWPLVWY